MMIENAFGNQLSLLLRQSGWSSSKLADAIGVDVSYIRRLVAGGRIPIRKGDELVDKISQALNLAPQKRSMLMTALKASFTARDTDLMPHVSQLGPLIDRLLGDAATKSMEQPASRSIWEHPFHGEMLLVPDISGILGFFVPEPNAQSYIYIPDLLLSADALPAIFVQAAKNGTVNHFISQSASAATSISILENVFRVSTAIPGAPDRYRAITLHEASPVGIFATRSMVCIVIPISSSTGRMLALRVTDKRLCRTTCAIMRKLVASGRHLLTFLKEGTSRFQQLLADIEGRSSFRVGMFDEGLSFLTHPPHWYSDNAAFEAKAPWSSFQGAERRAYKNLLTHRLSNASNFLSVEEIVSEQSLIAYLSQGRIGEFYSTPFSPAELREHIAHLIEMIRTREARYALYVSSDEDAFASNKSWAAYNDAAFFGKVVGGESVCAIIESDSVASGFRSIFDSVKRKCLKRFPDPRATADWLTARAVEFIR
jgi:transcriptional regulator with XRE-family HTH domain